MVLHPDSLTSLCPVTSRCDIMYNVMMSHHDAVVWRHDATGMPKVKAVLGERGQLEDQEDDGGDDDDSEE